MIKKIFALLICVMGVFCSGCGKQNIITSNDDEPCEHNYSETGEYYFLGSSVFYGHGTTNSYSFVDMFYKDYVVIDNESGKVEYLLKDEDLQTAESNETSVYKNDEKILKIFSETSGEYNNKPVSFESKSNGLTVIKDENGSSLGTMNIKKGEKSLFKTAVSGTCLAYNDSGTDPNYKNSYWKRLVDYKDEISDVKHFICQLSTNDAAYASEDKLSFGQITDDNVRELENFDYTTTYGAIEYIIAFVAENYKCPITFVICPYMPMAGGYGTCYTELRQGLLKLQDKWGFNVIDMYDNEEMYANVTSSDKEWLGKYMQDVAHPTKLGYEAWYYPLIRDYLDNYQDDDGWEILVKPTSTQDGVKYRKCIVCGEVETEVIRSKK